MIDIEIEIDIDRDCPNTLGGVGIYRDCRFIRVIFHLLHAAHYIVVFDIPGATLPGSDNYTYMRGRSIEARQCLAFSVVCLYDTGQCESEDKLDGDSGLF